MCNTKVQYAGRQTVPHYAARSKQSNWRRGYFWVVF